MGPFDPAKIPGYAEAARIEANVRELSFLNVEVPLCGLLVRQLTPRLILTLGGIGNRFICGGPIQPEDVAGILWFLSPGYTRDTKARDKWIKKHVRRLNFEQAAKDILRFVAEAYQDAPPASGIGGKTYWAGVASLIDLLASEYGWEDDHILDTPIARLFQYQKVITHRYDPKRPLFNGSDAIISRWVADNFNRN